jgi:rare lipoprotein A
VTNLENGRSTVVRVNDRGPFARSRVLDVSKTAAQDLGMIGNGTARVRIEQLEAESLAMKQIAVNGGGPDEQRTALAQYLAGKRPPTAVAAAPAPAPPPPPQPPLPQPQPTRPPTPSVTVYPSVPPTPGPRPVPPPEARPTVASIATSSMQPEGGFYVQTGAFSTVNNAEKQRGQITSYGSTEISPASSGGREVYRVRLGPYSTQEAAGIVADRLRRSGYGDARVVAD